MPTYKFHNKNTGKTWEESLSISERDSFLEANPHIEQLVNGFPGIGRAMLTQKPADGFRDVLREMKKKHRGSKINTF